MAWMTLVCSHVSGDRGRLWRTQRQGEKVTAGNPGTQQAGERQGTAFSTTQAKQALLLQKQLAKGSVERFSCIPQPPSRSLWPFLCDGVRRAGVGVWVSFQE